MKTIKDLEKEEDKMAIFGNINLLLEYIEKMSEYIEAFSKMLDDKQKLEIIKTTYFKNFTPHWKRKAVETIKDNLIKNEIVLDLSIVGDIFDKYTFGGFVETLNDDGKMQVLRNEALIKKFDVRPSQVEKILRNMYSENVEKIIRDKRLIEELQLSNYNIREIICDNIEDDIVKLDISEIYGFTKYEQICIMKLFSDENKKNIILEDEKGLEDYNIIDLINSFGLEAKLDFMKNQQSFLESKNISVFNIVRKMNKNQQLEFINNIEMLALSEKEKRMIFAGLDNETKKKIEIDKIDEKYRSLIEMELNEYRKINPQLNGNIEQYKDLDELINAQPLEMIKSEEDRKSFLRLCEICPQMRVKDNFELCYSTSEEYIKAEMWIDSMLEEINTEWTDIQKMAYINMKICKKVSYTPEFGTEVESPADERALWKIIANGYGVCNGISQVEQYILKRIGIESELVSSNTHSFLKVKNIEIPTKDGNIKGDTLVDPTWDLGSLRYGAIPNHFCKNYEEIRKCDIDDKGEDHNCHKVDELENETLIEMDEQSLREVYKIIGVADRDGNFPIKELFGKVKEIDKTSKNIQANIHNKFSLLKNYCPEFATCQNSTIKMIRGVLFENNENFNFKRCIVSRVYDRADEEKKAVLYTYFNFEDEGEYFYYADKELGECIPLTKEQFEEKFECYESDLEKTNNKRLWEVEEEIEEKKEYSSGQIVNEGDER